MLNFFNFKKISNDEYLITNDFGRYAFVNSATLDHIIHAPEKLPSKAKEELVEKLFFIKDYPFPFEDAETSFLMRDSKNYLFSSTSLHIFVVTNACNLNCGYCQANDNNHHFVFMDKKAALAAVDIALSAPSKSLSFEFQGGEPLLNFDVIRTITEYAETKKADRDIHYSVVTNLTLLSEEMIAFFKSYRFSVSTSLDGAKNVHDHNRPYPDGTGSYSVVIEKVQKLREQGINVGAIQTTTRFSLDSPEAIIDEYVEKGFSTVFLRPLSQLGRAKKKWDAIGYSAEEYLSFYKRALDHIIELNKSGICIQENFLTILLSKVLHHFPDNYMELRSPCGASIGQLAYYANGDVFTCDEGRMVYEMGDSSFRIGNVFSDTYTDLISSPICRTMCLASSLESIPSCCDCVYQPYCGTCPVANKAMFGDIIAKSPNHYRCRINQGILDYLFTILKKNDPLIIEILTNWRMG